MHAYHIGANITIVTYFLPSLYSGSPLDLQSWLKYLIPDCYKLVCRALGCSETSTAVQIEAEIALSLQTEALGRSRSNTFREGAADPHDTHSSNNHSISSKKLPFVSNFSSPFLLAFMENYFDCVLFIFMLCLSKQTHLVVRCPSQVWQTAF